MIQLYIYFKPQIASKFQICSLKTGDASHNLLELTTYQELASAPLVHPNQHQLCTSV